MPQGKKKFRSERSFTVELAMELLRAELRLRFDNPKIFILWSNTTAEPVRIENGKGFDWVEEKTIRIKATFGPFKWPHYKERVLFNVEAMCVLFNEDNVATEGTKYWKPLALNYTVRDHLDRHVRAHRVDYVGLDCDDCQVMVDAQFAIAQRGRSVEP